MYLLLELRNKMVELRSQFPTESKDRLLMRARGKIAGTVKDGTDPRPGWVKAGDTIGDLAVSAINTGIRGLNYRSPESLVDSSKQFQIPEIPSMDHVAAYTGTDNTANKFRNRLKDEVGYVGDYWTQLESDRKDREAMHAGSTY